MQTAGLCRRRECALKVSGRVIRGLVHVLCREDTIIAVLFVFEQRTFVSPRRRYSRCGVKHFEWNWVFAFFDQGSRGEPGQSGKDCDFQPKPGTIGDNTTTTILRVSFGITPLIGGHRPHEFGKILKLLISLSRWEEMMFLQMERPFAATSTKQFNKIAIYKNAR